MTDLIDAAAVWPTLLIALIVFGCAPNLMLRLLLLAYPKDHPQRTAIWADLRAVPRWERPFWVCEQIDGVLVEGLRLRRRRGPRRAAPASSSGQPITRGVERALVRAAFAAGRDPNVGAVVTVEVAGLRQTFRFMRRAGDGVVKVVPLGGPLGDLSD